MKKLLFSALLMFPAIAEAREVTVNTPDGALSVTINDHEGNGQPTYEASLFDRQLVLPSALGFKTNFADFSKNLHITNTHATEVSKDYTMRQVKQSEMHYRAQQLIVDFVNAKGMKMSIEFQLSNNNVAFRYLIPRQKNDNPKCAIIESENTAFLFPDGTTTFICPQIDPMKGWERTKPSYEEEYTPDAPMATASKFGQGYTFPCLFHLNGENEAWVLVSETGVSSQYCGAHLSDFTAGKGYTIAYPQAGENNGFGSTGSAISLPGTTPWRTITAGQTLNPIVETTVQYDVVEPLYQPSEDYKAGRYTWSWLIWQDNSVCWEDQIAFIDLAAEMGYEYCLVDGFWDTQIGRDRMPELSRYAQSKGVALMLWYNSNGQWNDAPQTPRNCMSTNIARDKEMAWLRSIGVKGIKVDFFAGDKQETMKLYEDILYDANRYGIQVIFHGCTLPRGWERMYPNYVSSEAVLASENVYFSEHHAQQEPFELTLHPFCRNAVGTMDWGGIIMNKYMSRNNKSRHTRKTTDVFEIATGFVNQAAIQCVAIQPNNLTELPSVELDFLRQLPTTWDETRLIEGYPGHYVVLARRHGAQWYVAGLNATGTPLTLTLQLSDFNVSRQLNDRLQRDKSLSVEQSDLKIDKKGRTKIVMQPNGGVVLF